MKYDSFSPPGGPGDDPRTMLYVCVDDLEIDPVVQRGLQYNSPVWKKDWDWALAENITVAMRSADRFTVIEGQNRVERLKRDFPGTRIWAILAGDSGREVEAGTALGITRGRKPHQPIDQWKLAVEAGNEHEVVAEQVLAEFGLSMEGNNGSRTGIAAVRAVSLIIHSRGRTPSQGAALLERIFTVITRAYGADDEGRFEGAVIRAVADVLAANPDRKVDLDRFARALKERSPRQWMAIARDSANVHGEPNLWSYLARDLVRAYNKGKRTNKLAWSRDAE